MIWLLIFSLFFVRFAEGVSRAQRYRMRSVPIVFNKPIKVGKTHFIIPSPSVNQNHNYDSDVLHKEHKQNVKSKEEPRQQATVFFTSKDDIRSKIESLIDEEQNRILIVIFALNDAKIAKKLVEARNRGVHIEIITDFHNAHEQFSKIDFLYKNNIPVWYNKPRSYHTGKRADKNKKMSGRMHHKFSIFSTEVVTGSLNFTSAAMTKNFENITILSDREIINGYYEEFERIKQHCLKYQSFDERK